MSKKSDGIPIWAMSLIALTIVFGLWIGGAYYMWDRFNDESRGAAGDSFGGITALFSGLAFAALIVTLVMQRRELELQREELADTREVMKDQSKHIERQNFEATFFRMIQNFETLISGVEYKQHPIQRIQAQLAGQPEPAPIVFQGRDALEKYYSRMRRTVLEIRNPRKGEEGQPAVIISEDGWKERYEASYNEFEPDLGNYFRVLYNIIDFAHRAPLPDEEKYRFIKILRAALSSPECGLIFLNGATHHAEEKMKPLIERYSILKHLPEKIRNEAAFVVGEYRPSAFQKPEPTEAEASTPFDEALRQSRLAVVKSWFKRAS